MILALIVFSTYIDIGKRSITLAPNTSKKPPRPHLEVLKVRGVDLSDEFDLNLARHRLVICCLVGARVDLELILLVWVQLLPGEKDGAVEEVRGQRARG